MRIAVLLRDRCQPKRCNLECIKFCPRVRMGDETVVMGDKGKPVISEQLCVGCGICVHKCPFDAIRIIGLPSELEGEIVHQYHENGFRLYRLPTLVEGQVLGLLGPNGIGKTTALAILSGEVVPNLGRFERPGSWQEVIEHFSGTGLQRHFERLASGKIRTALKPQYVDKLPVVVKGKVRDLLGHVDDLGRLDEIAGQLHILAILDRDVGKLSGGELQRIAIAATMLKDAGLYMFDEPSSYLDIHQRLNVARAIKALAKERNVIVVEHDLAVLDFLADNVHLMYGSEGAYGVVAQPRPVRTAVNVYLEGYMREENVRFREQEIRFEPRAPRGLLGTPVLIEYGSLHKRFATFSLKAHPGKIHIGEVVGVVGPNATGKTTFVRILAGELHPTRGAPPTSVRVSYKPQYIKHDFDGTVRELLGTALGDGIPPALNAEVMAPMDIQALIAKPVPHLSGGELQRVATALCLSKDADVYLIDEPSAYLDSNQRMETARAIRRYMEKIKRSALIVDHDIYFLDLVADSLLVFEGVPSKKGEAHGPYPMREGMNAFLRRIGITFRRDTDTKRPRINKEGSRLDREQKERGEYYYSG
ncbi:MAG: ribosome biogenesis/translation initiation ATPase RLI [Candidatus Thermoplasmatota archaeon]